MELETVDMTHPSLPGRVVAMPAQSVGQHQLSGWVLVDEPDAQSRVAQILVGGGLPPEEAERIAAAAGPPEPPPAPEEPTEAPAPAGASALPDTEKSPRARRIKGDE